MAPMVVNIERTRPVIDHNIPVDNPAEWASGAQSAYREVLGELDRWCRTNDSPRSLNSWIAEEAVRQSW